MASGKKSSSTPAQASASVQSPPIQSLFQFNAHYLRDLSFESPQGPAGLFSQPQEKPSIDLNVDIKAQRLNDNTYELIMIMAAKATADDKPMFLVEIQYGGIFTLLTQEALDNAQYIMLAEAPYALFPFARRVIADVTRDGGFPPLMLDGVDFRGLFAARSEEAGKRKANA
jgi:preprotein translocase subunit SecB